MTLAGDFVYDPYAPAVMNDPFPYYEVLRERYPVYFSPAYDTFFLSRFQDAWDFLTVGENVFVTNEGSVFNQADLLRHNAGGTVDPPTVPLASHLMFGSPVYDQVRKAHAKPTRPGPVRTLEPFIRGMVRDRLDVLLQERTFDLVQEFAGIAAASTVCHLFRIPLEEAADLLDAVNRMTRTDLRDDGPGFARDTTLATKLLEFVRPHVAARRAAVRDDSWPLVDGMLDLRVDGHELSDLQIAANLTCVLVGGTETLPKIMGHGLLELSRHPAQLAAVRSDLPNTCGPAVEEMNRFCGPAQWFGRTARVDTSVAGVPVRAGQRVVYLTQSCGRDPREFDDPDEFRWDRPIRRTLAFGRGQHFCIGVHVARLEQRIILEEFLGRVRAYEVDVSEAVRRPSCFQWGYSRLPVEIRELAR